jgi:hypothetical protein
MMAWVGATGASRRWDGSHWRDRSSGGGALHAEIHDEVCRKGYDADRKGFTHFYGSSRLDASLLMSPSSGYFRPRTRGWSAP